MQSDIILLPILRNSSFFVFMYMLGAICIFTTGNKSYLPYYLKLYAELFLDLYITCCLLTLISPKFRKVFKVFLFILLYSAAYIDVFCYIRTGSTLSPSILRLVFETNAKEATEFINTYVNANLLFSPFGLILLLCICHISIEFKEKKGKKMYARKRHIMALNLLTICILAIGCQSSLVNKRNMLRLFSFTNLSEIEDYLGRVAYARRANYIPIYRLAFSLYANRLANQQITRMIQTLRTTHIDACSFSSSNIVLIIGESYNRNHSQLYGYPYPTTPRQVCRAQEGNLFAFDNAVTPYNITSEVLKNSFSLNDLTLHEEWCDKSLFTTIFKRAGYHVAFISNQFTPNHEKDFFDFSGGMFLNSLELSKLQFDYRNDSTHTYDETLIKEYKNHRHLNKKHNLIIFSLLGQHVGYKDRFPQSFSIFSTNSYRREDLSQKEIQIIADYDNATLYNDYVIDLIIREFENEDAIVIYMPDHGDECYDGIRTFGRLHQDYITPQIANNEYKIPFWIWCSPLYVKNHQEIVSLIQKSTQRPFYSDDLPHLLLFLGGISQKDYRPQRNIISPEYDELRLRLLRKNINFDECIRLNATK
ncbi:MAG TPA: hypothetical protein DCG33_08225 [Prevotellaceae bacterium]|nr:hypothetical protein [Prevotellaceae bacterium]